MTQNIHKRFKNVSIIKLCVVFFCLIVIPQNIFSQNVLAFELRLTIEQGDTKHAKISITKNGQPWRVIDSKSKYDLDLDLGVEYVITATKMGYISKSIVIDTRVPSGRDQEEFAEFQSEIVLKPQPNEDVEVSYTQPVGRISYSDKVADFDYDKNYDAQSREMQKKAELSPKKRPKTVTDSVKSNPEIIQTKAEIKKETNPPKIVEKSVDPPIPSTVRIVVERTVQQDKLKITYRTVTINGVDFVYRKEEFSWGGVYFYRDAKNITESTFEKDTK